MTTSTAYNALVLLANVQPKDEVLVYSASGGVGMASVQLAVSLGAEVTAVVSTSNIDFAKELGADFVLDYKHQDIGSLDTKYDVIFDTSAHFSFAKAKNILTKEGIYLTTNATPQAIIFSPILNIFRSKSVKVVMTQPNKETLKQVKSLAQSEARKPFIHKVFKLNEMREAHNLAEKGGFRGKIIALVE